MRIYGVCGWKNTGKTTLMTGLVAEIARRGLKVSTVKHAHHETEVDVPGTDSFRHRAAGAGQVILSSPFRWALMTELRGAEEPPLDALLARLSPCDLVLVEGYKRSAHPKVEAHRPEAGQPLIARDNATVRAVASTLPAGHPLLDGLAVPVLPLNDVVRVADFVLGEVGL
ncbi:MAG: molybdopterin-guanine dinucleotide biosynthesis protein B [Tabrizicola sp.]